MYINTFKVFSINLQCILLSICIIPYVCCGTGSHDYSHSHASYPVQNPGSSNPDPSPTPNCSRFHEISKIVQPGLTAVKEVNFLGLGPMIAAYGMNNKDEVIAFWYTFDLSTNSYQLNSTEPTLIKNGEFIFFDDIQRKGKDFAVISAQNLHNSPIITNATKAPPPNGNFLLGTQAPDKLSQAVISYLDTSFEPAQFHYYQLLPAEKVGQGLVFKLVTKTNSIQDCALFTISNKNIFEAKIYCFHPLDFQPDDEAVHEFQTISVNEFPLLTTLLVGKTTLVVIVDSDKHIQTMMKPTKVNLDVGNVWTHAQGATSFANTQQIRMPHTVTVDSVLTAENIPFLALGSRPDHAIKVEGQTCTGLVSIYSYNKQDGMFELNQNLHVKNLVQLRFLLVAETGEVLLYALSSDAVNNISIYSFKGAKSWVFLCSVTVPGASYLETVSFVHQGQARAHVIAVTPTGATVVAA